MDWIKLLEIELRNLTNTYFSKYGYFIYIYIYEKNEWWQK